MNVTAVQRTEKFELNKELTTDQKAMLKNMDMKQLRKSFGFVSGKIFGDIIAISVHPTNDSKYTVKIVGLTIDDRSTVTFIPLEGPHKNREITTSAGNLFDRISPKTGLPCGRSWLKNFIDKLSMGLSLDKQDKALNSTDQLSLGLEA